jgi:hypothetical protein
MAAVSQTESRTTTAPTMDASIMQRFKAALFAFLSYIKLAVDARDVGVSTLSGAVSQARATAHADDEHVVRMAQSVGAGQIVGMAVAIGAGGIVLNQMSALDIVNNSSGVMDVASIFQTAGTALVLLSIAMIVGAAAVIMGFFGGGGGF